MPTDRFRSAIIFVMLALMSQGRAGAEEWYKPDPKYSPKVGENAHLAFFYEGRLRGAKCFASLSELKQHGQNLDDYRPDESVPVDDQVDMYIPKPRTRIKIIRIDSYEYISK